MEKKLSSLFEYQRFEGNNKLASIIDDTMSRYSVQELEDDSLMNVAGGVSNDSTNKRRDL